MSKNKNEIVKNLLKSRFTLGELDGTWLGRKLRDAKFKEEYVKPQVDFEQLIVTALKGVYARARAFSYVESRRLRRLVAVTESQIRDLQAQLAAAAQREKDRQPYFPYITTAMSAEAVNTTVANLIPTAGKALTMENLAGAVVGKCRRAITSDDACGIVISSSGDGSSAGFAKWAQAGQEISGFALPSGALAGSILFVGDEGAIISLSTAQADIALGTPIKPIARVLSVENGTCRIQVIDRPMIPVTA